MKLIETIPFALRFKNVSMVYALFNISDQLCNSSCHGQCILLYNVDNSSTVASNKHKKRFSTEPNLSQLGPCSLCFCYEDAARMRPAVRDLFHV